jgi:NAD(P)-dependent dehydrogenase (short-subunit alcohol dehydrogenase family)
MSLKGWFSTPSTSGISIAFISFLYAVYRNLYKKKYQRYSKIPKLGERVLVLGASSGIGRSIARQYAVERGARVCVVGRREVLLNEVVAECRKITQTDEQLLKEDLDSRIFGIAADFANVDDMVRTRTIIEASKSSSTRIFSLLANFFFEEWNGLDTLVVAAGVSAVQPLMTIPGVATGVEQALTKEGIQRVVDVAAAATQGNYVGPLISAVTFVSFS